MKKATSHLFLAIGVFSLLLSACKEDNEQLSPAQKLTGIWNLESSDVDLSVNNQDYMSYIQQIAGISNTEKAIAMLYVQGLIQEIEVPQGTTFEFKPDNQYEIISSIESPETGSWTLDSSGSLLTLSGVSLQAFDLQNLEFDVQTLTTTSLVLSTVTEIIEDFDQNGEDDILTADILLNFSK